MSIAEQYKDAVNPKNILAYIDRDVLENQLNGFCYALNAGVALIYNEEMPATIHNLDRIDALGTPEQARCFYHPFCKFYRDPGSYPNGHEECKCWDNQVAMHYYSGDEGWDKPVLYRCHLQMWDMAFPLCVENRLVGVLFAGQKIVVERNDKVVGPLQSIQSSVHWPNYEESSYQRQEVQNALQEKVIDAQLRRTLGEKLSDKTNTVSSSDLVKSFLKFKDLGEILQKQLANSYVQRSKAAEETFLRLAEREFSAPVQSQIGLREKIRAACESFSDAANQAGVQVYVVQGRNFVRQVCVIEDNAQSGPDTIPTEECMNLEGDRLLSGEEIAQHCPSLRDHLLPSSSFFCYREAPPARGHAMLVLVLLKLTKPTNSVLSLAENFCKTVAILADRADASLVIDAEKTAMLFDAAMTGALKAEGLLHVIQELCDLLSARGSSLFLRQDLLPPPYRGHDESRFVLFETTGLWDMSKGELECSCMEQKEEYFYDISISPTRGLTGWVAKYRAAINLPNRSLETLARERDKAIESGRARPVTGENEVDPIRWKNVVCEHPMNKADAESERYVPFLAAPLLSSEGHALGVIRASCIREGSFKTAFSDRDLLIMESAAKALALGFEAALTLRRRQQFVQSTVHEVLMPMHGIMTIASEVLEGHLELAKLSKLIEIAAKTTVVVRNLELLARTNLDQQIQSESEISTEIVPFLISQWKEVQAMASEPGLFVRVDANTSRHVGCKAIRPDATNLVLKNLIYNAIKYSCRGTDIILFAKNRDASFFEISVQNEGVAIGEDERETIFDEGHRSPNAKEQNVQGSGLGLYVSRAIMRAMGGDLVYRPKGHRRRVQAKNRDVWIHEFVAIMPIGDFKTNR